MSRTAKVLKSVPVGTGSPMRCWSTTESGGRRAAYSLPPWLSALALALAAAPPAGAAAEELVIGYLALKKDPRYTRKRTFARFLTHPLGRPYVAAKVAIEESRFVGSAIGVEFKLKRKRT